MNTLLMRRLRPYRSQINLAFQFVVVAMVAALCTVLPAHAEAPNNQTMITVSPVSQRLELKTGEKYEGSFKVINAGVKAYSFKVYASPYQISGNDYTKQLFDENSPGFNKESKRTQINRWVSFPTEKYTIQPGQTISVPYEVNVPSSIPDGGQYGVIFAQTEPEKAEGNAVIAQKRVGMLLYGRTDGNTINQGSVDIVNPSFLELTGTVKASVNAKNTGNTDFDATAKTTITDLFGNQKFTKESTNVVLPETTREISNTWENAPQFGWFKVVTEGKLLDKSESKTSWVLVMSPFAALIAFGILALIIAGVFRAASYRSKR